MFRFYVFQKRCYFFKKIIEVKLQLETLFRLFGIISQRESMTFNIHKNKTALSQTAAQKKHICFWNSLKVWLSMFICPWASERGSVLWIMQFFIGRPVTICIDHFVQHRKSTFSHLYIDVTIPSRPSRFIVHIIIVMLYNTIHQYIQL